MAVSSKELQKLITNLQNKPSRDIVQELTNIERNVEQQRGQRRQILGQSYQPSTEELGLDILREGLNAWPGVSNQRKASMYNRLNQLNVLMDGTDNLTSLSSLGDQYKATMKQLGNDADAKLLGIAFKDNYDKKMQAFVDYESAVDTAFEAYNVNKNLQTSDIMSWNYEEIYDAYNKLNANNNLMELGMTMVGDDPNATRRSLWKTQKEYKDKDGNNISIDDIYRGSNEYRQQLDAGLEALVRDKVITQKEAEFIKAGKGRTYGDYEKIAKDAQTKINGYRNKASRIANHYSRDANSIREFVAKGQKDNLSANEEDMLEMLKNQLINQNLAGEGEESINSMKQSLSGDSQFNSMHINNQGDIQDDIDDDSYDLGKFTNEGEAIQWPALIKLAEEKEEKARQYGTMEFFYDKEYKKWDTQTTIPTISELGPAIADKINKSKEGKGNPIEDPFSWAKPVNMVDESAIFTDPNFTGHPASGKLFKDKKSADSYEKTNKQSVLELANNYSPVFANYLSGKINDKDVLSILKDNYGLAMDSPEAPAGRSNSNYSGHFLKKLKAAKKLYNSGASVSEVESYMTFSPNSHIEADNKMQFNKPEIKIGNRVLFKQKSPDWEQYMPGASQNRKEFIDSINTYATSSPTYSRNMDELVAPLFDNIGSFFKSKDSDLNILTSEIDKFVTNSSDGSVLKGLYNPAQENLLFGYLNEMRKKYFSSPVANDKRKLNLFKKENKKDYLDVVSMLRPHIDAFKANAINNNTNAGQTINDPVISVPNRKERAEMLDQEYEEYGDSTTPTKTKYIQDMAKKTGNNWKTVNEYITDDDWWQSNFSKAGE